MALPYYAAMQYYLKRKDAGMANEFKGLFTDLFTQYESTYSSKTTGAVQTKNRAELYNIFGIPPSGIS